MNYKQSYYQKNKERWKDYAKKQKQNRKMWTLKNNERIKELAKIWRDKNKETINKRRMEYYYKKHDKNKEYNRIKQKEYRRKKGVPLRSEMTNKDHWNWQGGQRKCIDCGEPTKNRSKSGLRCFHCNRKFLSGPNNPSWTGGHSSFRKSLYATKEYKDWRRSVFERDNYTCQDCGQRGGSLEAHHKKRMILFVKECVPNINKLRGSEIKNKLIEYEPLWNISNGLTLCIKCHKKESKKDKKMIKKHLEPT